MEQSVFRPLLIILHAILLAFTVVGQAYGTALDQHFAALVDDADMDHQKVFAGKDLAVPRDAAPGALPGRIVDIQKLHGRFPP